MSGTLGWIKDGSGGGGITSVTLAPETVTFTSDGTFDPTAYPGLQYVRVRCQGAGGGSSGSGLIPAPTDDTLVSVGASGSGGTYAESVLSAADLGAGPISVTVGVGGAGSDVNVSAQAGEPSSFGSLVVAPGGFGAVVSISDEVSWADARVRAGRIGGVALGAVGDLIIPGGGGTAGFAIGATPFNDSVSEPTPGTLPTRIAVGGNGGGAHLAGMSVGGATASADGGEASVSAEPDGGRLYGGGAPAPITDDANPVDPGEPQPGLKGGDGIVIVEIVRLVVS